MTHVIKQHRLLIQIILISIILVNLFIVIFPLQDKYFNKDYWYRFPVLEKTYENSQYVIKNPKGFVPDEIVYSYAGGVFIKGVNPILVLPEVPPMGKYMIGLSILLFKNEHIYSLFFGIMSLFLLFLTSRQVLRNNLLALIPPVLFSFEPLFKNQFVYTPLLDTAQLCFILAGFYFFNKGLVSKNKTIVFFLLFNIFLGLFISTKFFMSGFVLMFAAISVLVLNKKFDKLIKFLFTTPVSLLILLGSYIRMLSFGFSLRDILGVQRWVFEYWQGAIAKPLTIFPLLFLNKWYVWWGNEPILSDPQWLIIWPIIASISILVIVLYIFKKIKRNLNIEIFLAYIVLYFLFFSFGRTTVRYFVILLPFLYLVSVFGIYEFYKSEKMQEKIKHISFPVLS